MREEGKSGREEGEGDSLPACHTSARFQPPPPPSPHTHTLTPTAVVI